MTSRNETLFNRAKSIIPGGVNSPVRAFGSVGGVPRFIQKAEGAYVWDADGTKYIDYVGSWGPAIVGHAHPEVIEAVREAALDGLSFGAPTEGEIVIAEEIAKLVPSVEQVRLVSSGTEATMSAIRLARGFTGRDKIIKFEGCYHGHSDSLLVKAGSGLLTFGNPSSAGVPADFTKHTLVLEYNNVAQLEETFAQIGGEIACVIVEPFAGNMNLVRPSENFACTGSGCFRLLFAFSGSLLCFRLLLCLGNRVRGEAAHLTGFQTAFLFRHSRAGGNLFGAWAAVVFSTVGCDLDKIPACVGMTAAGWIRSLRKYRVRTSIRPLADGRV